MCPLRRKAAQNGINCEQWNCHLDPGHDHVERVRSGQ